MYKLHVASSKVEKKLDAYLALRNDMKWKLEKLKEDPRRNCGAHPLYGKLKGNWSCWLGDNIRMMYIINDATKIVIIKSVGTHKIY